jgi:hypothetical protein
MTLSSAPRAPSLPCAPERRDRVVGRDRGNMRVVILRFIFVEERSDQLADCRIGGHSGERCTAHASTKPASRDIVCSRRSGVIAQYVDLHISGFATGLSVARMCGELVRVSFEEDAQVHWTIALPSIATSPNHDLGRLTTAARTSRWSRPDAPRAMQHLTAASDTCSASRRLATPDWRFTSRLSSYRHSSPDS